MIQLNQRFFPSILLDNDQIYIDHLIGIIESVDEYASLEITKKPSAYSFRIVPSVPKYSQMLLQEILRMHNVFLIHLDLSKSIKTSGTIVFEISL